MRQKMVKKIVKRKSQKTHSLTVLDPKWLTNSRIPLAVLPYLSEFHLFTLECFAGSDWQVFVTLPSYLEGCGVKICESISVMMCRRREVCPQLACIGGAGRCISWVSPIKLPGVWVMGQFRWSSPGWRSNNGGRRERALRSFWIPPSFGKYEAKFLPAIRLGVNNSACSKFQAPFVASPTFPLCIHAATLQQIINNY